MNQLTLEGAELHYHRIGQGPILICIPGANGTGDIYIPFAKEMADHFTVVAIDRRGFGASTLTEPLPEEAAAPDSLYRVKRDAKDIAELAKHLSDEQVYIIGSSSGAIVAMHVLKEHPEVVKKIAFHEPPINTFLSDADYWQEKNNEIVDLALTEGMPQAMKLFSETLNVAAIDAEGMKKAAEPEEGSVDEKRFTEMQNWFKYEIRQYTTSDINLDEFRPYLDKITLLNGTDSKGSFPQDVDAYISKKLGIDIIDIPGGHLGYVQKPAGFAEVIQSIWLEK